MTTVRFAGMLGLLLLGTGSLRAADPAAEPTPSAAPAVAAVDGGCAGGSCGCATCQRSHCGCCRRFWEWLTYQPLHRVGCCGCCHHCDTCCFPPLYAYFPCRGCAPVPTCACSGAAHSCAPIAGGPPAASLGAPAATDAPATVNGTQP